jgi:DNA polymerase I-like protein with 3'-5' exonuclease and polymerase domains
MNNALNIMNEFCLVITEMERNGINIDTKELRKLETQYTKEKIELEEKLQNLARYALGDTPFSLSSNDDLSMLVFSRKPLDKREWAEEFNLGTEVINGVQRKKKPFNMSDEILSDKIYDLSSWIYKTKAHQCTNCMGTGKISKRNVDGRMSKPRYNCPECNKSGVIYTNLDEIAGFRQLPSSTHDLAAHGYKCNKDRLELLAREAEGDAKTFLTNMVRFAAISHYLSSFIKGIKENVGKDGILHTQFMQCVTATGRLSSRNPNFHNQPRAGTFPIRRVVTSRFINGTITEVDYAQLEFRVAAALSHDEVALNDIIAGRDVHQHTADVLTRAGQPTSRQDAKHHTFKPLYGGTSGTKAEKVYYKDFLGRYDGIKKWHKKLIEITINHKTLTLPSGREYTFPWAKRSNYGMINGATKIKNYPVQGFATADIVPLAAIKLHKLYIENDVNSVIINEVHDSLVTDTFPGEEKLISELNIKATLGVIQDMKERFDYNFTVPLLVEVKNGVNWLDMKLVGKGETSLSELKALT